MITFDKAEQAAKKFSKLPCYNAFTMTAGVGCEDRNFCVKVYLYQRVDIDHLPKEIDGVGVYYQMTQRPRPARH